MMPVSSIRRHIDRFSDCKSVHRCANDDIPMLVTCEKCVMFNDSSEGQCNDRDTTLASVSLASVNLEQYATFSDRSLRHCRDNATMPASDILSHRSKSNHCNDDQYWDNSIIDASVMLQQHAKLSDRSAG